MLTLADLNTGRFQTAAQCGYGSTNFLEVVNDVVNELCNRGDWKGTLLPICVQISNGCVTWPRWVGEVRKMHSHRGNIDMRNQWYQFLDTPGWRRGWDGWCGQERQAEMQYRAPTFQDITGTGNTLQFYVDVPQDVGATITVFGQDDTGNDLKTQNGDGTWSPGITIVASLPYGSSAQIVSHIDRVVCTATIGPKRLYAFQAASNNLYNIAVYDPTDTNPSFLRYKLKGGGYWGGAGCCAASSTSPCLYSVIALVKLARLPIQNPTDLVLINNREALLDGIRAAKLSDAGDVAGSSKLWAAAVEKLNRQLENEDPEYQLTASDNTFGDTETFCNQAF